MSNGVNTPPTLREYFGGGNANGAGRVARLNFKRPIALVGQAATVLGHVRIVDRCDFFDGSHDAWLAP